MTRYTRRRLLAMTGAAATVGIAGCSNGEGGTDPGGDSNDTDNDDQISGITSLETVIDSTDDELTPGAKTEVYLNVELADRIDANQVTLERTDVEGVTSKSVSTRPEPPHATILIRSKSDSETISQAPYEVVARSSDGKPVARREWTPDTSIEYSNIKVDATESETFPEFLLRFDVTNNGDLDLAPPEGHITDGYPTIVHESDTVGSTAIGDAYNQGVPPSETAELETSLLGGTLLMPEDGECPATPQDIELTLEYPNRQPDKLNITIQLGSEPIEVGGDTIGCAETTVDGWSKDETF